LIARIKQFFEQYVAGASADPEQPEHPLQVAAAALLMEMANADHDLNQTEADHITNTIRSTFGLTDAETDDLVRLAEDETESSTSLHEFTSLINQHWPLDKKIRLVELMWQVAYADLEVDKHEQHLMRKIVNLLYIPQSEYIAAKMRAQREMSRR